MSAYTSNHTNTQNELLMNHLMQFYQNKDHLHKMMRIINGESRISLRIVDWFVTNYSKKNYTVYENPWKNKRAMEEEKEDDAAAAVEMVRFKVYNDYKLKLKAYSKRRFDPFCRWERISIPYGENHQYIETTIGQLNFFKWVIENRILEYIENHYHEIETDMNSRNSTSKRKTLLKTTPPQNTSLDNKECTIEPERDATTASATDNEMPSLSLVGGDGGKTRKKREELSVSACKCIKKEMVKIVVKFH
jgi:hypothetical protein